MTACAMAVMIALIVKWGLPYVTGDAARNVPYPRDWRPVVTYYADHPDYQHYNQAVQVHQQ